MIAIAYQTNWIVKKLLDGLTIAFRFALIPVQQFHELFSLLAKRQNLEVSKQAYQISNEWKITQTQRYNWRSWAWKSSPTRASLVNRVNPISKSVAFGYTSADGVRGTVGG